MVIERLVYDEVDQQHDASIFTANQVGQDFSRAIANYAQLMGIVAPVVS